MDQKARMLAIGDGLDEASSGPDPAGVLGDARVDDLTAVEGENDEDVEEAEPAGYDNKEVAGSGLAEVISDEGAPALAALSVQTSGATPGDRAGRDEVTELGELGQNDLLTPRPVFNPHPADQGPQIRVYGGPTPWTAGAPAPEEMPRCTVPADDGLRFHQEDGAE